MINPSLQPLFQTSSSVSVALLLLSSLLPDSESYAMEVFSPSSCLRRSHFPGIPLVILCGILRLFLAFCLEYFALPGGVAGVFNMEISIQLGMLFLAFLTILVLSFKIEAFFLPLGVAVLV